MEALPFYYTLTKYTPPDIFYYTTPAAILFNIIHNCRHLELPFFLILYTSAAILFLLLGLKPNLLRVHASFTNNHGSIYRF